MCAALLSRTTAKELLPKTFHGFSIASIEQIGLVLAKLEDMG
jgi:hypothetical protein